MSQERGNQWFDMALEQGEQAANDKNAVGLSNAVTLLESSAKCFTDPTLLGVIRGYQAMYSYILSIVRHDAGDRNSQNDYKAHTAAAKASAEMAIKYDSTNLRGRLVLTWLASDQLKVLDISLGGMVGDLNFGAKSLFTLIARGAVAGVSQAQVAASRQAYATRLSELLDAVAAIKNSKVFLSLELAYFMDRLIALGDFNRQHKVALPQTKRLYGLLASFDIENDMTFDDVQPQYVAEVKKDIEKMLMLSEAHFNSIA